MKVKELIKQLQRFDGDLDVALDSDSVDLYSFRIESVSIGSEQSQYDCVMLYGNLKFE